MTSPWGSMPSYSIQDPTMKKWCGTLTQLSGGRLPEFGGDFCSWLDSKIVVVDDYAYFGVDFQGDTNMFLLDG